MAIVGAICSGIVASAGASATTTTRISTAVVMRRRRQMMRVGSRDFRRFDDPIVASVVDIAFLLEQVLEQTAQVLVVRFGVEVQFSAIAQVLGKLFGTVLTQRLNRRLSLHLADAIVFLRLALGFQTLPGQLAAAIEIHEHVAKCLEVVATRLLIPQMRVDRSVTRRTRQRLALDERDMASRLWINVALGQTEIDDEDHIEIALQTDKKVVRLNVAMNKLKLVHRLDAIQHLLRQQQNRLERESASAKIEQVLERRSQQVHDQHEILLFLTVKIHVGHSQRALHMLVDARLVLQLWMSGVGLLQFDRHFMASLYMRAFVDHAKRTRANLGAQSILAIGHADFKRTMMR
mmetsp:Transcript_44656/g.73928  ORF Transcript_44656/g.73928 Transcript_44656/m.73928 type:complete len:348 (-) Transcript_44656:103-1146(-)